MGLVIPFPRAFRRRAETPTPKPKGRFRELTRQRLKAIITRALEILDSLDHHMPPHGTGEPGRRSRRSARAKSA